MRVGLVDNTRVVQSHLREGLENEGLADRLVRLVEKCGRLHGLRADCPHRIERIAWILRDKADGASPQRSEVALWQSQYLLITKGDVAGGMSSAWQKPQDRTGDCRFAGAGLANKGKALATAEFETDIADDLLASIGDRKIVDPEKRDRSLLRLRSGRKGNGAGDSGGQSVLRSHRLILFTERTVAIVTKAGAYTSHGHLR
ncbi:hypothetical protein D3C80_1339830 [compost metagenome]